MKTITVEDNTWKMLTIDKMNLDCKSLDEVINKYKVIVTNMIGPGIQEIPPSSINTNKTEVI